MKEEIELYIFLLNFCNIFRIKYFLKTKKINIFVDTYPQVLLKKKNVSASICGILDTSLDLKYLNFMNRIRL